ncbi:MAG: 50S ribosomal protein L30 [Chloroflexi bacterium]|jgi:large subunit ribosomal protein L30|nr:50S ribosomal protein L30 [Chloroflexota bacterium]HOA21605.1 50S ribosomal protein L30 [Anaerolineaceae bacterium]HOA22306.1 50S ribosomal protein L30 [Anaerolineaceae bacterium]HOE34477.1 50S ribosomal protein L30 [Anaerolineaceae bacterium]HOT25487.1 50S ribosomal protein L30 [Anaerolineaceae bacterium]
MTKQTEKTARVRVTLKKSGTGYPVRQKATLKALGFHHVNQVVEHEDTPALRGMLTKVSHLVEIETVNEEK